MIHVSRSQHSQGLQQPRPIAFAGAEVAGWPQAGGAGDAPTAQHDPANADDADADRLAQGMLAQPHGLKEFFLQEFAGMDIRKIC